MAEAFDVAGRGAFYDAVGAIRDVVQNHLLQVLAYLAMDPPADDDAEAERSEKRRLMCAIRPIGPGDVVRGQYAGYLDTPGVAPGATAETYAAVRLWIDNWRWADVPFLIRTGKALAVTSTEIAVRQCERRRGRLGAGCHNVLLSRLNNPADRAKAGDR